MGLAINGKVYGTSGVTYIGNKPIDCGYINVDGSPRYKQFSQSGTTTPSIFDLLTPGTYLTDYNKVLRHLTGMYDRFGNYIMQNCYPTDDYVPTLIHIPDNRIVNPTLTGLGTTINDLFACFCFLIKYSKTDYSKDPDKKAKMDKALSKAYIYIGFDIGSELSLIQPPEDELDNFTFKSGSHDPLPVDEFFMKYFAFNHPIEVLYKGKQVDFYQYTDKNNLANKIVVYLAGGYGVSIAPDSNAINKYAFMKLHDPDKDGVVAVYKYSKYKLYSNYAASAPTITFPSNYDTHGYNIPVCVSKNAGSDKYSIFYLYFEKDNDLEQLPDKDFENQFTDYKVYTDVPYNPYIFSNLDIDNRYTWFADSYKGMITLDKAYYLDYMGSSIFYGVMPTRYYSGGTGCLPQGKYLVNPKSVAGDIKGLPCDPNNALIVEAKSVDNQILEQRVNTDNTITTSNAFYRRGKLNSDNDISFSNWDWV